MERKLIELLKEAFKSSKDIESFCEDMPNINFPTLGGLWLWNNILLKDGWKIQQHTISKHYRILDSKGNRRAWGLSEKKMKENIEKLYYCNK